MIWLIGNKGMLGQDLTSILDNGGLECIGTDREVSILDYEKILNFAKNTNPDWIINCSAYTTVDQAEDDSDAAYAINRDGVRNIALLSTKLDIPFVHISTDYVFDGSSADPLDEIAPTSPISIYGKSKLAGEEEIRKICKKYFIIRTAWLYGQYGPNFVYTMIKLMNKTKSLNIVNDQYGSPTWTRDLSSLILAILRERSDKYGVYHLSGEGECSWFGFALEIYRIGKLQGLISSNCVLDPCSSEEFQTRAKRPTYSLLSKNKVKTTFPEYTVPLWKDSLKTFLEGINENDII